MRSSLQLSNQKFKALSTATGIKPTSCPFQGVIVDTHIQAFPDFDHFMDLGLVIFRRVPETKHAGFQSAKKIHARPVHTTNTPSESNTARARPQYLRAATRCSESSRINPWGAIKNIDTLLCTICELPHLVMRSRIKPCQNLVSP